MRIISITKYISWKEWTYISYIEDAFTPDKQNLFSVNQEIKYGF